MKFDLDRLEIDPHCSLDRLAEITAVFIDRLRDDDWHEIPRAINPQLSTDI